jgi:hypothetical protein
MVTNTIAIGEGKSNPATPLGGAWAIGTFNGTAVTGALLTTGMPNGVYIASSKDLTKANSADDNQIFTPSAMANIDRKLDDGLPNIGSVRALGKGGGTNCADKATGDGIYREADTGSICGALIKVQ